jgi:hypothetical protein
MSKLPFLLHSTLMSHSLLNVLLIAVAVTPITPFVALAVLVYRRWRRSRAMLERVNPQTWRS